jgi:hypothetical protein
MARTLLVPALLRCTRGYGVVLNPADGSTPPALRLAAHFRWIRIHGETPLSFYTAPADDIRTLRPVIERHRGPIHFISLAGIRDLILESSGRPLALLHVGFGTPRDPCTYTDPQPGYTHMWCTPTEDPLARALRAEGIAPAVTGRILQRGLAGFDWTSLTTAEM